MFCLPGCLLVRLGNNHYNPAIAMKKIILQIILGVLVFNLAACVARADTTNVQIVPFHGQSVTNSGCPGSYTGYAYMTNNAGTMWIKPPANVLSGTFTDRSGNTSAMCVTRQIPITQWCNTNSVGFTVVSGNSYEFYARVKNDGLTNAQPLMLQIVWH